MFVIFLGEAFHGAEVAVREDDAPLPTSVPAGLQAELAFLPQGQRNYTAILVPALEQALIVGMPSYRAPFAVVPVQIAAVRPAGRRGAETAERHHQSCGPPQKSRLTIEKKIDPVSTEGSQEGIGLDQLGQRPAFTFLITSVNTLGFTKEMGNKGASWLTFSGLRDWS